MIELIDVTADDGHIANVDWLSRAEPVHRQLRAFGEAYAVVMTRVFAGGGRMRVAVVGGEVAGVAVYRCYENTHAGMLMYVDDLVTDARLRSTGVGAALLHSLEQSARDRGCKLFSLDSGTQRRRAHAFYLRERLEISSFHFVKALASAYKICDETSWRACVQQGVLPPSPADRSDGFIHLSTREQLAETAAKHYRDVDGVLWLLEVDLARLGDTVRFEPSRGGALFPHVYGPLPHDAVVRAGPLHRDDAGTLCIDAWFGA